MPLHVKRQVIGPGESALAQVALEGSVARVLPEMTRELVGAGELPAAALPAAVVGLLTCGRHKERERSWLEPSAGCEAAARHRA